MSILGHGVDIVEVARIAALLERHGQRFLDRVFTPAEQQRGADSRTRAQHLAARFAAKEAVLKALGTGKTHAIAWTDVEVVSLPSGQPALRLAGRAGVVALDRGIGAWHLSLSHCEEYAVASVIACRG